MSEALLGRQTLPDIKHDGADEVLIRRQSVPGVARHDDRAARDRNSERRRERALIPAVCALAAAAWLWSRYGGYAAGSGVGYYLGVAGGIALLLVFLYPLRKRIRFLQSWGATKGWFALHMACGIGGPILILAHCSFQVSSINAGVALASLLLVAASGIVGRFIYTRIHHGLYGTRLTLAQLQAAVGVNAGNVSSRLQIAPQIEERLKAFQAAIERPKSLAHSVWSFLTLGSRARWLLRQCTREFARAYRAHAREHGWDAARQTRDLAAAKTLIATFLSGVQRLAQFRGYERLFSLWHVLHVPLVWMLVLSATAHVIAVHAY
ncbi:MAG TPA: hypothetical protein VLC73_04715 [Burkholderiales bacterium]|nr:hypothetical protein [Burkholderiales bacterium]